ncbi:hypothetical protein [Streptomyces sp. NPDC006551]|uniref:hypothetical protein n=1 Tax=Streptomyces sp. NPDC006551 TaxID=3157178 RepID=UPI0033B54DAC
MTAPTPPALDCPTSTPTGPHAAPQPVDTAAVGEPKGAARKGVVTALRPNRSAARASADPTPDTPGIRIFAPPVYRHHYDGTRWSTRHGALPTAAYACACGLTGTATGPGAVAALIAEYDAHRSTCTGTPAPPTEGRHAA